MSIIRAYKETYGKRLGIFVCAAYIVLLVLAAMDTYQRYREDEKPLIAAIIFVVLLLQFIFRNKVPNAVIGMVGIIFSLLGFFRKTSDVWLFISPAVAFSLVLISACILVTAYFTHNEI